MVRDGFDILTEAAIVILVIYFLIQSRCYDDANARSWNGWMRILHLFVAVAFASALIGKWTGWF